MSLNMIIVLFQRYEFLISGQRQYMEKPKRTGGGGRTGEARKDEVSLLPLGLHYPYRYSIVTTRTFPIGIRCPLPQNKSIPSTFSAKPETFLPIVPRGTPVQSRISRSLFLIALYICFMQCIDNKANKRTMIKGRASPVAITYRPNSNAMYPQNKVSTKYINIPIKIYNKYP